MERQKLIVWRKTALDQVIATLRYYEEELSLQAAEKFYSAIEVTITKLSEHPTIGRPSAKKKGIRSWIINKHFRLFYVVRAKQFIIVAFYDMRQDPSKRKY